MKQFRRLPLVLVVWSCVFAPGLKADPEGETVGRSDTAPAKAPSAARVFIDPGSGRLGGPPPGVEPPGLSVSLQQKLSRSGQGLRVRRLPDGTRLLHLQGRFQNMSAVTLGESENRHFFCSHSVDALSNVLMHGADLSIDLSGARP